MKKTSTGRRRALSIRARVLTLALVPCIVFLLAGVAGTGYLIFDAAKTRNYFTLASDAQRNSLPLIVSLQEERRLTLRRLASFGTFQSELIQQRTQTDALAGRATESLAELSGSAPTAVTRAAARFTELMRELPAMRARVDGGQVSISESFSLYNDIVDQFIDGTKGLAQFAPDAETAYLQLVVASLLGGADLMQRSDALAAANLVGGGLLDADFSTYQGQVSSYHLQLDSTMPLAEAQVREQYAALTASPAWLRLISVENVLLNGGTELPVSEDMWRAAAGDVGEQLMALLTTQSRHTNAVALSKVDGTLIRSIVAGVLVLLLAIAVFVFALRLSRRLIERLTRLRGETLELAEKQLPELVERVRAGADVKVDDEVRLRDYGADEIGEVADAFNKAQQTALAAAVQEAKTREGTNKVFLNIAHRSQVIVHRQLKTLDEAERRQEDPEQLELLFQLDHLSTRQRRNAENLIILGGGQPGRRWRNPVSITEIVRGASAETEDFPRVKMAKLPSRTVIGPVVGDLVHLLAELIDNAATFSPPGARVEVRGNVVGKGVVLEIEDQGLGIETAHADDLNSMLANPPDFGIMALSSEPRLGLFVVARLAARHGISVTLRESAYGGTRAIVLVRNELLGPASDAPEPEDVEGSSPQEGDAQTSSQKQRGASADAKTETRLAPVELPVVSTSQGASVRLTIPGAVNLPDLPPLPMVEKRPGEDLFRPQRPVGDKVEPSKPLVRRADLNKNQTQAQSQNQSQNRAVEPRHAEGRNTSPRHAEPRHQEGRRPEPRQDDTRPQPQVAQVAPGRPPLPRRNRQQNLVPQLRDDNVNRDDSPVSWPADTRHEDSPEQARSRLTAFQAGTRRGRDEPTVEDTTIDGDNTFGSTRNGQHRSE